MVQFISDAWTELKTVGGHSPKAVLVGIFIAAIYFFWGVVECWTSHDPKCQGLTLAGIFASLIYLVLAFGFFAFLILLSKWLKFGLKTLTSPNGRFWNLLEYEWVYKTFLAFLWVQFFVSTPWMIAKDRGACMHKNRCTSKSFFQLPLRIAEIICPPGFSACRTLCFQSNNLILAILVLILNIYLYSWWKLDPADGGDGNVIGNECNQNPIPIQVPVGQEPCSTAPLPLNNGNPGSGVNNIGISNPGSDNTSMNGECQASLQAAIRCETLQQLEQIIQSLERSLCQSCRRIIHNNPLVLSLLAPPSEPASNTRSRTRMSESRRRQASPPQIRRRGSRPH